MSPEDPLTGAIRAMEQARRNCEAAAQAVAATRTIRQETQARRLKTLDSLYRRKSERLQNLGRWYLSMMGQREFEQKDAEHRKSVTTPSRRR